MEHGSEEMDMMGQAEQGRKIVAVLPGEGWVVTWKDSGREGMRLEEQIVGWMVFEDGTAQALVNSDDGEASPIACGELEGEGVISHVGRRLVED